MSGHPAAGILRKHSADAQNGTLTASGKFTVDTEFEMAAPAVSNDAAVAGGFADRIAIHGPGFESAANFGVDCR